MPRSTPSRGNTAAWKRVRRRWITEARRRGGTLPCGLCSRPIYVDRYPWPADDSLEVDHVLPVALGGTDAGETQPTHRRCNQAKRDDQVATGVLRSSREWF